MDRALFEVNVMREPDRTGRLIEMNSSLTARRPSVNTHANGRSPPPDAKQDLCDVPSTMSPSSTDISTSKAVIPKRQSVLVACTACQRRRSKVFPHLVCYGGVAELTLLSSVMVTDPTVHYVYQSRRSASTRFPMGKRERKPARKPTKPLAQK